MDSFWTNILSDVVYGLFILGGGVFLAYLKNKHSDKAPAALYGFIGAACIAVLIFAVSGRAVFTHRPPEVTTDNIEENVKLWAEHLGMNIGPASEPDSYFAYSLGIPNSGFSVEVFRLVKEKPSFLQFKSVVAVAPEHQQAISKMSQPGIDRAIEQLTLELDRANLGIYIVDTLTLFC